MRWFRRFRFTAAVLGLVLVATACGGGDSSSDTTTTTAATTGGGSTDGSDDTTTTTTTTTEPEQVSGDSGSDYCERVRDAEASNDSPLDFSFFGKTPAQLQAQFESNLKVFEQWKDVAPGEIDDDIDVIFNFYKTFVDRATELEWNLEAMADDEVFNTAFDDPAVDAAGDNIDKYTLDVCGVDFSATADPGTDDGDGQLDPVSIVLNALPITIPDGLLSADDIACMSDEMGSEFIDAVTPDYVVTQADIALLVAAADTCGIEFG